MEKEATHTILLDTGCGQMKGLDNGRCLELRGLPFATAGRFRYGRLVEHWEGLLDATEFGPGCPQNRAVHEHLEHPTRRFYKREFREGLTFQYSEDCLNLNLYIPYGAQGAPVILFFFGGGFDSGLNREGAFDGTALAERGILTVFANYRVGPLGYLTHREIQAETGRDGNFGLDDQRLALLWVKAHIRDLGGDPDNLTLMGQSAGAISVQYLCLNREVTPLFRRAVLLSGGGRFPSFALPRTPEQTRPYWLRFLELAGCRSLEELRQAPLEDLFEAVEKIRRLRRDNSYNTMPVIDGALIPKPVKELFRDPPPMEYLMGFTNADMFAPLLAWICNRFGRRMGAYVYCFDLDAPGDDNRAFHSSELRYVFGTLDRSWRPYGDRDREASRQMLDYLANFARGGDPNGPGLPVWSSCKGSLRSRVLRIGPGATAMGRTPYGKLLRNFLRRGDPIG